ncbi:hypothetical protein BDV93DRAFT_605704 [Ceratobasidium sp. AG-I]|nr:hypothetical protein BDV93DRAFT_605704 [Ceratobasidium sp. AG-I]
MRGSTPGGSLQAFAIPPSSPKVPPSDSPAESIMYHSYSRSDNDSDRGEEWPKEPQYDPKYKASVEAAFRVGLRHPSGDFLHAQSCATAPNPGLVVDGVGMIKLPLAADGSDDTHAKSLINACVQAPFGQGERVKVDKEVRDTWQADAAQVHFTNPAWATYIDAAMKSVCVTLGVETETTTPKCELYKLLVYQEGSHFLPHVDSEKTEGMFATMVVVLPSYFEGGAVHLAFNDASRIVDFGGAASAFQTSVLAWYTDVTHEVKPITGGYRLALAYNLFRPIESSAVPIAPIIDPSLADLRQTLAVWIKATKQGKDAKAPEALAWLLEHKYSRASMCFATLKGPDAHLVRRARLVAEELGLCLGLAILTLKLQGPYDEDWGWKSDDPEFQKYVKRRSWVKYLVNLEGQVVSDRLRFTNDLKGEMMPAEWRERLERVRFDEYEHDNYIGNEGVGEKRWYRRTVLVLWPQGMAPFEEARISLHQDTKEDLRMYE